MVRPAIAALRNWWRQKRSYSRIECLTERQCRLFGFGPSVTESGKSTPGVLVRVRAWRVNDRCGSTAVIWPGLALVRFAFSTGSSRRSSRLPLGAKSGLSIAPSTRPSSDCGTVRPSALAVLGLIEQGGPFRIRSWLAAAEYRLAPWLI